jgi:Protein of unknown function (DUF3040)
MPLSEYEKRTLDDIEQALSLDDPDLAATLASSRRHRLGGWTPRRIAALTTGLSSLLIGLAVVLFGVHANNTAGVLVGALGSVVVIAAATITVNAVHPR